MSGRYKGYFTNLYGQLYRVEIEKSGSIGNYTEVPMAYESPFVAKWESDENPFTPSRKSTASMTFINSAYMDDAFPSKATETEVRLILDKTGEIIWKGYMKANVYNAGFESNNEEIELEASDGIAALQYLNYTTINNSNVWNSAGVASAYEILKNMAKKVGIKYIAWNTIKKDAAGSFIIPTDVILSEHNFFSSDNNEPWKCDEVLDEICKYLGVTALQVGDTMYLIDFSEYKTHSLISFIKYNLDDDTTSSFIEGIESYADSAEAYMSNGANISFYPVYNKATVKASLYTPEDVLPDIFTDDENKITYRLGDSSKVILAHRPTNPWKRTDKEGKEQTDGDDAASAFPIKLLDCEGWESWYYSANTDGSLTYKVLSENEYNSESAVTKYIGGTLIDRAQAKASHKYYDVTGTPSFDRGLFLRCDGHMVQDEEFGYDMWKANEWGRQVSGMCQYIISGDTLDKYNVLFSTFGDYRLGCPADSGDTYLVMNITAMWERYPQPYVNSDWSSDALSYTSKHIWTRHYTPIMNFILQCGEQYYNGKEWQYTRCGFRIPFEHSTEDIEMDNKTFAAATGDDWNKEMQSYNNILWLNWSTAQGFKISLKGLTDRSGKVYLHFLNPNTLVSFQDDTGALQDYYWGLYTSKYTINGAVWVTDFSLTVARDGSPAGDSDIAYENTVDEDNINEISEEVFKINTAQKGAKASYSFAENTSGGWFTGWKQTSTDSEFLCPEKQWIAKMVNHFGVPRREITLTLSTDVKPYGRVHEGWTGKEYAVTGTEVDYAAAMQTITMKEMN